MKLVARKTKRAAQPRTPSSTLRPAAQSLTVKLRQALCPRAATSLARRTGFQVRSARKLSAWLVVQSACLLVTLPQISLRTWAMLIGLLGGGTLSKQALAERITPQLVSFLQAVLGQLMDAQARLRSLPAHLLRSFRRVLIEDSTGISAGAKVAALFAGPANQLGSPRGYVKIQGCFNLRNHQWVHFSLSSFRRNDQRASADVLDWIERGDLLIRDLGYFATTVLAEIQQRWAFYLSRWRYGTQLWERDGRTPVDLLARLRRDGRLDGWFLLGAQKLLTRVVAVPAGPGVGDERRRKIKQNRDQRSQPSAEYLALQDWTILITNVPAEVWSAATVAQAYGLRWRIEIIFKAWKSHLHLRDLPEKASMAQVEAIVLAKLMVITLLSACWLRLALLRGTGPPSWLKLVQGMVWLLLALVLAELGINVAAGVERQLRYHTGYEKRKRGHFFDQLR